MLVCVLAMNGASCSKYTSFWVRGRSLLIPSLPVIRIMSAGVIMLVPDLLH
jgi:hypothetical protein